MSYIFGKFGMSNAGATSGTSGMVNRQIVFAGGNNVTLSQSINASSATLTISAANQTVQTQNLHNLTLGGNTAGVMAQVSSGTLTLAGGNNITLSQNGNAVTISGGAAGGGSNTFGMSNLGNTSGTTGMVSGSAVQFAFAGGNNVTLSQSINGSSGTLTISAASQTVQTQNVHNITLSGNTAGVMAQISSGTLNLAGGNNITLSQNGNSVSIIGGAGGPGGGGIALANSETTFTSGTANLNVAGGAITIASTTGQSFNFSVPQTSSLAATGAVSISTNGSTISIGAPTYSPMSHWIHNSAAMYSSSTLNMINTSMSLVRMLIPEQISFSRLEVAVSVSGATAATANTAAMALSAVGVLYSRSNATLTPIIGQSSATTYSYASNTGVYSSITGPRLLSFNLGTSLTAGEYYFGLQLSSATSSVGTATTNLGWSIAPVFGTSNTVFAWQNLSAASATSANLYQPMQGVKTASISNTSQTIQQSQVNHSGTLGARANMVVVFRNN